MLTLKVLGTNNNKVVRSNSGNKIDKTNKMSAKSKVKNFLKTRHLE